MRSECRPSNRTVVETPQSPLPAQINPRSQFLNAPAGNRTRTVPWKGTILPLDRWFCCFNQVDYNIFKRRDN